MHCPNCGQKTSAELKFCRSCGMKLDSVARAVSSHLEGDEPEAAPDVAVEKSSGSPGNRFYSLYIGLALSFIGVAIAVIGQGIWAKSGALIALLGVFIMIIGALPAAAKFDRALLRSMGNSGGKSGSESGGESAGQKEMRSAEPELTLPSADDFQPVPSVTEATTRDLHGDKTKVKIRS